MTLLKELLGFEQGFSLLLKTTWDDFPAQSTESHPAKEQVSCGVHAYHCWV